LTAERDPDGAVRATLTVRLAAPGRTALAASTDALQRLLTAAGADAVRLDGGQLYGLAATLPLAGAAASGASQPDRAGTAAVPAFQVAAGHSGLVLGVDRRDEPVCIRMFRREPTHAVLVGGLRCAHLVVFRALATGAQVIVQTGRPQAWERFVRGVSGPGDALFLVGPNRPADLGPATALRPQLVVVDTGTPGAGVPVAESPWRTSLLVFDEVGAADADDLYRADLALLQPLRASEAALVGSALGLGGTAQWLTRIRSDMLGVVAHRRTLRWLLLSATPLEQQLIGPVSR
jgi:hypothetical protein